MPGWSGESWRASLPSPEWQTTLLIAAGTALLPLQIWPPMPLAGMRLSDLFFALAVLQFLATRREIPPAQAALPIAAFAAGAVASGLFGGSPVKLLGHLMLAAVGWMTVATAPEGARLLRGMLVAAAGLAALTAALTVAAFYAGFIGYDMFGVPQSPFLYFHGELEFGRYPRPRGTMVTGAMLTSIVATGLALLWFERGLVPWAWLRGAIFLIGAVALFFAFSRTIVVFALVVAGVELWRRGSPTWAQIAFVGLVLVSAAALWISLRYDVVLNPTRPWAVEVLTADGDRFGRWRLAAASIMENPLLGVGPGIDVAAGWSAHNTWLNLWAVLGIVPLAAFAFLAVASLRAAIRAGWAGLTAALIVVLVESVYIDVEDLRHVWLLFGIALSTLRHSEPAEVPRYRPFPGTGRRR